MSSINIRRLKSAVFLLAAAFLLVQIACRNPDGSGGSDPNDYQPGSYVKITSSSGGFDATLHTGDHFGKSAANIGDLNKDGVADLAVGADLDDDGGTDAGALWVLFMNGDGLVKGYQKISATAGGLAGALEAGDYFGKSVAGLGDLDGDGTRDIAVGASLDDDGGTDQGAVYILFLNTNGTVKDYQKVSESAGGFTGVLDPEDWFGKSLAYLGVLDGLPALAVGADQDDDGGINHGAVWILFLNPDGTVDHHQKISDTQGGFTGTLFTDDLFGKAVCNLGDLDGDGVIDLAVSASKKDDLTKDNGVIYILFLDPDGTVDHHRKLSYTAGTLPFTLDQGDDFGKAVSCTGDVNGDGVPDLAVGAFLDDDGGHDAGAIYILFLNPDGTLKSPNGYQKVSELEGNFGGFIRRGDYFGISIACLGDLDGDGIGELAVGAALDDETVANCGTLWILYLDSGGRVKL